MHTIDPFPITADPNAYIAREATEDVLAEIVGAIRQGVSPIVLAGPGGIGKTMLLRVLSHVLRREMTPLYLPYPHLEPNELWQWALQTLGLPVESGGDPEARFMSAAKQLGSEGVPVLLAIDDAGQLPGPTVRVLEARANEISVLVAATTDDPLLEIDADGMASLKRAELGCDFGPDAHVVQFETPMDRDETEAYVHARLERAGVDEKEVALFDRATIERLHGESGGYPTILHDLAAGVLLEAARRSRREPVRAAAPARTATEFVIARSTPMSDDAVARAQADAADLEKVAGGGIGAVRRMVAADEPSEELPSERRGFARAFAIAAGILVVGLAIGMGVARFAPGLLGRDAAVAPVAAAPPTAAEVAKEVEAAPEAPAVSAAPAKIEPVADATKPVAPNENAPTPVAEAKALATKVEEAAAKSPVEAAPVVASVAQLQADAVSSAPAEPAVVQAKPVAPPAAAPAPKRTTKPAPKAAPVAAKPAAKVTTPAAKERRAAPPNTESAPPVLAGMKPPKDIAIDSSDDDLLPISILVDPGVSVEVDGAMRGVGSLRGLLLEPGSHMVMAHHRDGRVEARALKVSIDGPFELDLRE